MAEQRAPGTPADQVQPGGPSKVGVYDRPANAGRPAPLLMIVVALIIIALILAAYFYFM